MAQVKARKQALGLRVIRDGKVLRELDLEDKLTIGGAHTDHIIKAGEKKSAVLFRLGKTGEAELLLAENYRGEIGGEGEMLSFGHLKTLGLLRREGDRYVVPIQRGRTGHVEAENLTFEFGYRAPLPVEKVTIPKGGPGYEVAATWIDPDNVRYYRTLAVVGAILIAFMIGSQYAEFEEKTYRVEDLVRRVTKVEIPESEGVGIVEDVAPTEAIGGGGGGGGGGGEIGAGVPTTGVVAAITTLGTGSGRSIADLLGAGAGGSDLDGLVGGLGGLTSADGGGGLGGGLGAGGAGGTGLGGGVGGMAGLAGGGGRGPGGPGLKKKRVSISGAVSSVGGAGANEANRSPTAIASVIRRHLTGIQNAYNSALKKNPNLGSGKITVRFTITTDGSVSSASIISDSLNCAPLSASILSRIRSWRFPRVESGSVTVVYPFVFVASE